MKCNKQIEPKIIIEPLLRTDINKMSQELNIYCFNSIAKIVVKIHNEKEYSFYNENLKAIDNIFKAQIIVKYEQIDEITKSAVKLSEILSKDFNFVRVDWLIFDNSLYFQELTFTPYSGFYEFKDSKTNLKLGNLLNIGENK